MIFPDRQRWSASIPASASSNLEYVSLSLLFFNLEELVYIKYQLCEEILETCMRIAVETSMHASTPKIHIT